jgi:hypothetical protein
LVGALDRTSAGPGGTSWRERAVTAAIGYGVLRGVEELVKAAAGG